MAESMVCDLAAKIGVFLEEMKSKLPRGVIQDAEFIKAELERMSVLLRLAETVEDDGDVLINKAVKLAYDIEDVIDEFKSPAATHVMKFFESISTRLIRRMKHQHQSVASKMLRIISRISHLSVELQRLVNEASSCGTRHGERVEIDLQYADGDVVGIDSPKKQLLTWLTDEDPSFKVISVVGMGGVGKTTLVKNVYEDDAVQSHFGFRAWITLSHFSLEDHLRQMIQQVSLYYRQTVPEGIDTIGSRGLKEILKEILPGIRFLVVLDDVWNLDSWDAIKNALPLSDYGNRVLLTTRNRVLSNMLSSDFEGRVYSLMPLSADMSWQLFYTRTFKHRECPAHLVNVAQYIVSKCEGLPLAIVAIANVLSTMIDHDTYDINQWETVNLNLESELIGGKLRSVSKALLRSYYDLPSHLKACLQYASLCPTYLINCWELLRLWMAEGFVKKEDGKTEDQVANGYLSELVNRSLIQGRSFDLAEDGSTSILECHIHGMLRGVILSKCRIERFASLINEDRHTEWPKEARRICAHNISILDSKKLISSYLAQRLRTLIILSLRNPIKSSLFSNLKQLKVLHFKSVFESFPDFITELYNLKYLSLKGYRIDIIPSSIEKLRNLEILDLAATQSTLIGTRLPPTIKNLQQLRRLSGRFTRGNEPAFRKRCGFKAISDLGCLHSLQELWYIELNQEKYGNNLIKMLGKLCQLKKLGLTNLKREDSSAICTLIEMLTSLHWLEIDFQLADRREPIDLQDISSPPEFLQWIKLQGRVKKLPNWITSLGNLAVLKLQGSRLRNNVLESIQALPSLVHLELLEAFDGNKLLFEDGGFQKLKRLHLENLQGLQDMVVEKGSMACLEKLHINYCPILENVPSGIENLAKLKDLQLRGVSENLADRIDRAKGGEDSWRIKHVMKETVRDQIELQSSSL